MVPFLHLFLLALGVSVSSVSARVCPGAIECTFADGSRCAQECIETPWACFCPAGTTSKKCITVAEYADRHKC